MILQIIARKPIWLLKHLWCFCFTVDTLVRDCSKYVYSAQRINSGFSVIELEIFFTNSFWHSKYKVFPIQLLAILIEPISEVDMCPAPPEMTLSHKGHHDNNLIVNGLDLQPNSIRETVISKDTDFLCIYNLVFGDFGD